MTSSTIRVPATTSNLGSGFDCMGIALQIYNWVTVRKSDKGDPAPQKNLMVHEASLAFFQAARKRPFAFQWKIRGEVPRSRGLGSSVTVRLGILHGLNELAGAPLSREAIFQLCADLEGHADNAAPAAFGGFALICPGAPLQRYRVDATLEFVLLIPDFEVATDHARKSLPKNVAWPDVIDAVARASAVAGAFASRDYTQLQGAFDDRLHQPHRKKFVPFLEEAIAAGRSAGALGGWLSGSGSAVACATLEAPERVAAAMLSTPGLQRATAISARADNTGVRIQSGK